MQIRLTLALIATLATPGFCETPAPQTPMSGAEFGAYVTGKTLTYAVGGYVYGTEQYKENRKVIWAFTEDECREGYWYEQGPEICFVYEDPNDPQCWLFYASDTGLRAQFVGDEPGSELSEVAKSPVPMGCMGPDVGV